MQVLLWTAAAGLTVAACGSGSLKPQVQNTSDSGDLTTSQDGATTGENHGDASTGDAAHASGQGAYDDGPYHCCAKGEGKSCCSGAKQGTCFEYGGIYEDCTGAGEIFEAKVICAKCCNGLKASSVLVMGNEAPPELDQLPDGCDAAPDTPPSTLICLACGDGTCSASENRCNCPEDCPKT